MSKIVVIIPAFNEENSVGKVIEELPGDMLDEIVVVNNNSSDKTSQNAAQAGATVIQESINGYGRACLKGIEYCKKMRPAPDIILFIDADYSDYPQQADRIVRPILNGNYDLVIGSRALGKRESGSMTIPQIFGNWLATRLIQLLYGVRYTDLGPFRAIRFDSLMQLEMTDKTYGWTVEMQVKAAKHRIRVTEVPVDYRTRIGFSKISGTIKGTVLAGYKIISTIIRYL